MELIVIAAVAANGVIGRGGELPWHLPEDLRHFREVTLGHTLIMGRRTHEAIGRALDGRGNIVLSRDPAYRPHPGCRVAASLDQALALCASADKVFLIGGGAVFREGLARADTVLLTRIHAEMAGDVFFPDFDPAGFQLVASREVPAALPMTLLTYRRVPAAAAHRPATDAESCS